MEQTPQASTEIKNIIKAEEIDKSTEREVDMTATTSSELQMPRENDIKIPKIESEDLVSEEKLKLLSKFDFRLGNKPLFFI